MTFPALLAFIGALCAGALAFGVLFQGQRKLAHWVFATGMLLLGCESLFGGLSADAMIPDQAAYWQDRRMWISALVSAPWLLFSMIYARGNAREFITRWRFVLLALVVVPVGIVLWARGQLVAAVMQAEPGTSWAFTLSAPGSILNLVILVAAILVLANLERTFRASVGTMRWRIKFMILGLVVLFAVRAYTRSQVLLYQTASGPMQALNSAALCVAALLILRTLLRTGHFEVTLYPSQVLIHNSLTVLLAGVYLVIVGVLAKLAVWLGEVAGFQIKALLVLIFLVGCTVLLLSDRVRMHTRKFISRHFQRPLYDYRTVWRTFTEGTARRVEQGDLTAAVIKLASDIFQALSVTLWLLDERREKLVFAASTSLSQRKAEQIAIEPTDAEAIVKAFEAHPEPVDLDASKEFWASALRRCHPDDFQKGGNRVCVPLMAGGELLGLLTVGDRVGGMQFGLQDMDLLKSVADQAAASLLNIQLSQKLSQAKQLEAFQAMSAFFVHDLKNTASTLSLMLRNLPVHYQDPKFREDALRGISKTVEHINDVISRLNVLRHELAIQATDCDLNELVSETLKGQEQTPGVELVKQLNPVPRIRLDASQIQKVLTNLVLNARDAVGQGGQIRIETSQRNGWLVLAVSDTGCGMTPDFLRNNLYRPFQTTKKKGIGIGMFHCKMIVEAHRGRIEVESEPGKGTTFKVLLPLPT